MNSWRSPLFRFGHHGNAASVEAIAQWAGTSAGMVVNATRRTITAFLTLHDTVIRWPSHTREGGRKGVGRSALPSVSHGETATSLWMALWFLLPISQGIMVKRTLIESLTIR